MKYIKNLARWWVATVFVLSASSAVAQLNAFQCYTHTVITNYPLANVTLVDQFSSAFGTIDAQVSGWKEICAPAGISGPLANPSTAAEHLESFAERSRRTGIRSQLNAFLRTNQVTVTSLFGPLQVKVRGPVRLMVPTAKSLTSVPGPLVSPSTDHFNCYKVNRAAYVPQTLTVEDQFGSRSVTLRAPYRLCVPANMNDQDPGAENHTESLLCYRLKPDRSFHSPGRLFLNNEFGTGTTYIRRPVSVCLPSTVS